MTAPTKPKMYRDLIDHLVSVCNEGQGQVGARRVRAGLWNANATGQAIADQHEINAVLARLSKADRDVLARVLSGEVELGMFEALKALEAFGVTPFETGYEGSAFNDFIGRLNGWQWPEK
jgi:hypothetical protein